MPRNPPDRFRTLTPICLATSPERVISFVQDALGGVVERKFHAPDGVIAHAEVRVGDSLLMVGSASEEYPAFPAMLCVYLHDVDAAYASALAAGASSLRPPEDQVYGDRSAGVADTEGNQWWLTTRIEDLTREEISERVREASIGDAGPVVPAA
jgi:PhnB protein